MELSESESSENTAYHQSVNPSTRDYILKEYNTDINDDFFTIKVWIKKNKGSDEVTNLLEDIASSNEISDNIYKPIKNNSETIGMVCYMENGYSEFPERNRSIHMSFIHEDVLAKVFNIVLYDLLKTNIAQIIVGHEHGDLYQKCHLQICVKFQTKLTKILNPGKIEITRFDNTKSTLLFMQQKGRHSQALIQYCQKEKDFEVLYPNLMLKLQKKKGKIDPFLTLVKNKHCLDKNEAENLLFYYDPLRFFTQFSNIQKALGKMFCKELPLFEWRKPYLPDNFTIPVNDKRVPFAPIFENWFETYCIKDHQRKKALCLFSKKRALGKTTFARSLVNDDGFILEYNNIFNNQNISKRKQDLRLLLLDDMTINKDNVMTWRSLVAAEKTTIRGFFCSDTYDISLPCIITTNDINMVTIFLKDPLFQTQVIVTEIDQYMGPPETIRNDLMHTEAFVSDSTLQDVEIEEGLIEKKRQREKNYC